MTSGKWLKIIALVQLAAALPWHGVYLLGWYARDVTDFDAWMVVLAIEGILFLLMPLMSLVGAFLHKRWACYTLMVFPVLAFIHGISAIPYVSHVVPVGPWRSVVVAIVNSSMIYFVYRMSKGPRA
jgi:multisubunit Na+/H+ antiporter MnhF subunit